MMDKRWDVLGVGVAAVDDIVVVKEFPQPDAKMRAEGMARQLGGLTAMALSAAARQGARAALCCNLGADDLSSYVLGELERAGVSSAPCPRLASGRPYHSVIIVNPLQGTRSVLSLPGNTEPPLEAITEELIASTKLLFVDHTVPAAGLKAARLARRLGVPVAADIERQTIPNFDAYLALIDHLIIGYEFARKLTGKSAVEDMLAVLSQPPRACCVITRGDQGCWYAAGGEMAHQPAYRVSVVDTTGCGDVFHGAYAAALARGESIPQAVKIAAASAALKATRTGGAAALPDLTEALRLAL